jgi:ribose/xylose/arabinose/galactoside ABC-type transport system permease subunit
VGTVEKNIKVRKKIDLQRRVPLFLLLMLVIVLSIANSNFLSLQAMYNLLLQISSIGIVALGAMIVLITAGIDFTAGYGMSLAGVTGGYFYMATGGNGIVLLVVSLAIGALVGIVNGTIIAKMRLHPFITTLAMMSVCQGVSMMISEGRNIEITSDWLLFLGQGRLIGFLPPVFLIFVLAVFIMYIVLNKTKLGVYTYAIGGNEDAVSYSGIRVDLYKIAVYAVAGLLYGLAAIVTVVKVTVITPNISGTVLLDGIAAAVVGGTSITGGRGTVSGTVIGTAIMTLISTLLTFLSIPPLLRDALKGLIIIVILIFDAGMTRMAKRR